MNAKEMGVTVHVRLPTERMDETQSNAAMMSAPSCIGSERLEAIDRRIMLIECSLERITDRLCLLENNYGRALALLEDRIRDLESRHTRQVYLLGHLSGRLHTIEGQELNEIDERLCRLEAAGVGVSK
jgi:uncharacterized coiled-coil protein SlyX